MQSWIAKVVPLSVLLLLPVSTVLAQGTDEENSDSPPVVEELGDGRFRVGSIEVDTTLQLFTIPGRIELRGEALESLAVAGAGFKNPESLLELDANAHEFKAACGLLGLTAGSGAPVGVRVAWDVEGQTTTVNAAELVRLGESVLPDSGWVYTGSMSTPDGELMAHLDGTLIGIVEDPASVIQYGSALDTEDSGALQPNLASLPLGETRVTLTVERY